VCVTLNTLLQAVRGRKDLQLLHIGQCHGSQGQSAATCMSTWMAFSCTVCQGKSQTQTQWRGLRLHISCYTCLSPPLSLTTCTQAGPLISPLWSYLLNHPIAKQLSWSALCNYNQSSHTRLLYMFKVLKYGVCNKYVRLFSSEQEFWCSPRYLWAKRLHCMCSRLVY